MNVARNRYSRASPFSRLFLLFLFLGENIAEIQNATDDRNGTNAIIVCGKEETEREKWRGRKKGRGLERGRSERVCSVV